MVNDYQVAASRRDDQLSGVRRYATTQKTGRVEHFLVDQSLFGVGINIPCENAAIKT